MMYFDKSPSEKNKFNQSTVVPQIGWKKTYVSRITFQKFNLKYQQRLLVKQNIFLSILWWDNIWPLIILVD